MEHLTDKNNFRKELKNVEKDNVCVLQNCIETHPKFVNMKI